MNKLISLLTDTLNSDVSDAHWDLIVEVRIEMEEKKQTLMVIQNYLKGIIIYVQYNFIGIFGIKYTFLFSEHNIYFLNNKYFI